MTSPATLAQVARLLGVSEKRAGKMHDGRYVILKEAAGAGFGRPPLAMRGRGEWWREGR